MKLPAAYKEEMMRQLGEEYPAFLECYSSHAKSAIRVNTGKIAPEEFAARAPFALEPVEWIRNGFYVEDGGVSLDPWHAAGVYYMQEASAMTPASVLACEPGDYVLDLCAAPGGKATELGARLRGRGLLVANDLSSSRARALLKNLERFGITNFYVTGEDPDRLAGRLPEFFDKILVDAPCSGEGMFRRAPGMAAEWEERGPSYYHEIQSRILARAADMLRPGGRLLYSTCTFSRLEDEGTVDRLLTERPSMRLISAGDYPGFSRGKEHPECFRIYPHKMKGEGHFIALFEKEGTLPARAAEDSGALSGEIPAGGGAAAFLMRCRAFFDTLPAEWYVRDKKWYARPAHDGMPEKLRYLRTGLFVGEEKKMRFEPSQALAMALRPDQYPYVIRLKREDPRVLRYLKGETLEIADFRLEPEADWILVCVEEFPLGWGKRAGARLKNKYAAGWRMA